MLRANRNPHAAMAKYHSFMISTANIGEALEESAGAAEAEVEEASERMRRAAVTRLSGSRWFGLPLVTIAERSCRYRLQNCRADTSCWRRLDLATNICDGIP